MEKVDRANLKLFVLTLPWTLLRFFGRVIKRFFIALGVLVALIVLAYVGFELIVETIDSRYSEQIDAYLGTDKNAISRLHDPAYFAEQSLIVSEDQKTVACISSPEHRILINDPADIPPLFTKAILASEDKNFFTHEGIDKGAILRALAKRILQESRSGASTLTMQIAKHLRAGIGRQSTETEKIGDIIMALRIEREFSRQQLLLKYVNMPYFGRGQYGIEAASRGYFGKPAKELALHQTAFMVALINKPALPDRSFTMDPLLKGRDEIRDANWAEAAHGTTRVLGLMLDQGVITDVEYARAANLVERSLRKEIVSLGIGCGAHDYFLERVRILYKDRFPINKGGLTISITRDDGLQDVLAKAVDLTLHTYLARHPNDVDNNQLRAGAFAVEFTGDVLAEVGNVNFKQQKYDVIATGWRQPGSTFKIFTYGGLIERLTREVLAAKPPPQTVEEISAEVLQRCTVLDAPIYVSLGRGRGAKKIENFHSRSEPEYRGDISCRIALGESRNTAAMRAGARAGIKKVIDLTYRLGLPRDAKHILQPYPTTAIGASEVNPLSMASAAAFVNGGFRVTPRFANDICHDGKSLLYKDDEDLPKGCDTKGENRPLQERLVHPAVSAAMIELLKAPLDMPTGTASVLRSGIIPGMDPLSGAIWALKPEEKKTRMLAFPFADAGELAGKTGTATNADGKTSDVWLLLFVPGTPEHPEKGMMLGFWMGKDSKDHPLGERGSTGGPGFAESGARNWLHSAATVLAFLQKERELLKPGYRFQPIIRDAVLRDFDAKKLMHSVQKIAPVPTTDVIIVPSDPEKQSDPTPANTSG
ncbi:MAG TPA: transglycosylase domain-containing protein [Casimicrobiaceae bacterium]|nr:transglycosylase domain-containing protein [Casimicrobiaceae bacterium]